MTSSHSKVAPAGSSQFTLGRATAVAMLADAGVPSGTFILRPSSTAIEDWVLTSVERKSIYYDLIYCNLIY